MSTAGRKIFVAVLPLIVVVAVGVWWFRQTAPQIAGRVVLRGTPHPEIRIGLDLPTSQLRSNGLTTRHYLVSSNGGLANAYVSIKSGLSHHTVPSTSAPVLVGFHGGRIEPFVVGVFTNQVLRFQNGDPMLHNLHAMPRVVGNREFNFAMPTPTPILVELWYKAIYRRLILRRPPPSKGIDRVFPMPESFIRLNCEVHPWEFGYICVADHPFFAVTDEKGNFAFPPGLPPGRYEIEARHLKAGAVTQEVVIAAGERKRFEFTLDVPAAGARPVAPPR
jgi:hypothetical protein